jgi:hypothetical protein
MRPPESLSAPPTSATLSLRRALVTVPPPTPVTVTRMKIRLRGLPSASSRSSVPKLVDALDSRTNVSAVTVPTGAASATETASTLKRRIPADPGNATRPRTDDLIRTSSAGRAPASIFYVLRAATFGWCHRRRQGESRQTPSPAGAFAPPALNSPAAHIRERRSPNPMGIKENLAELERRNREALLGGGKDRIEKRKAEGKLTARERYWSIQVRS